MLEMLPFDLTKHQYVIKANHNKLSKEWLEYLIYKPYDYAWDIREAEWHD